MKMKLEVPPLICFAAITTLVPYYDLIAAAFARTNHLISLVGNGDRDLVTHLLCFDVQV